MVDEQSDPASGIVARLERGAEFVARGDFTFDQTQILDKLGAHTHVERERYVLLLVEAANLLRGCTALELTITRRQAVLRFVGVALSADELERSFDPLFVSPGELDVDEARHQRGRQRLALGLATVLAGASAPLLLRQDAPGSGIELRFVPGGAVERHVDGDGGNFRSANHEPDWIKFLIRHHRYDEAALMLDACDDVSTMAFIHTCHAPVDCSQRRPRGAQGRTGTRRPAIWRRPAVAVSRSVRVARR